MRKNATLNQFPSDASSLERMINDIQARNRGSVGRIAESSFFRIPAVKSFVIENSEQNELLKGTGLDRKLPSAKRVELNESNDTHNKYMTDKIIKMRHLIQEGKPEKFWKLVDHEMRRSIAFRVASFNKVHKGWYRDIPLERVYQITYGMNKIIENSLTDLKYFRVEIPKDGPKALLQWYLDNPGGKYSKTRPLGVPTAPWRVILHMWNGFLVLFVEEELKRFNHAYTPGVGTKTCLTEWVTKVLPAKYVYEFDIKGFFNNVKIGQVITLLQERGMPFEQSFSLLKILQCIPDNITMEEAKSEYDKDLAARKEWNFLMKGENNNISIRLKSGLKLSVVKRVNEGTPFLDYVPDYLKNDPIVHIVPENSLDKGLPQGAAPSTTLSLLVLSPWYDILKKKGINLLMYADDGFLYSDKPFEPLAPPGLEFAEEKCSWVKIDGKWQKVETKFLGVLWNSETKLLSAKTRELSRLQFDERQLAVIDSYLSLDTIALYQQSRQELVLNTRIDPEDSGKDYKVHLGFFLKNADYQNDVNESPNSTSKSPLNFLKAARDTVAALGDDRMAKLVSSGIWGQALSKLYGGTWSRLFFPEKAQYNKGSWWDLFYDINQLSRDKRLQRLASTYACEWLLQHMSAMTGSVTKAKKHATWSLRFFKADESRKLMFKDLRNALQMEYYWDEKNLSLVPLDLEGSQSFNSSLPEPEWLSPDEYEADQYSSSPLSQSRLEKPIRVTPEERRVLRFNLMSKTQRLLYRPIKGREVASAKQPYKPFVADATMYEIEAKTSARTAKELYKPYITESLKTRLNKAESLRLHKLVWETVYK